MVCHSSAVVCIHSQRSTIISLINNVSRQIVIKFNVKKHHQVVGNDVRFLG